MSDDIETMPMVVPTHMNRIWRLGAGVRERYDISSLTLLHGGAPCPAELKHAWIDWIGPECHRLCCDRAA